MPSSTPSHPAEDFFCELDDLWDLPGPPIPLRIIGSAALMLQTDYERGTKDSDILETPALGPAITARLRVLAGQSTTLHKRHRIYLDIVPVALPFLPTDPLWHPLQINTILRHFQLDVLDITDVAVSKLKRFLPSDRNDIAAMIERDLIPHDKLLTRFRSALNTYLLDSRAEDLPRYIKNLNRIERDDYDLPETAIETFDLPPWL